MKSWRPVWFILVFAAVLRILQLGAENFWVDEIYQIGYSRHLVTGVVRSTSQVLLHFVMQVAETEFATRFQSVVFSVAEVGLIYSLAKRYFDRRTATLAAVFLALSPFHIWYAQEVRWYSQWSFVATATFYLLARLLEDERPGTWVAYVALTVFNLYTFVLTIPVMAIQFFVGMIGPRKDRFSFVFRLAGAQLVAVLLAWPIVWWMLSSVGPTGTPRPTRFVVLPYTFFAYFAGYSAGPNLTELHSLPAVGSILRAYPEVPVFFLVFGWLTVVGIRCALRAGRPGREVILPWAIGMPLLMFLAALAAGGTYNVRYTLVSLPALYVVLGLGVASFRQPLNRVLAVGAVALCFAFSLGHYYLDPHYDKEDVRGALRYVAATDDPTSPVIVVGQVGGVALYYGPSEHGGEVVPCRSSDDTFNQVRGLAESPAPWALVSRDWDGELDECLSRLAPGYMPAEEISTYTGVRLMRLTRNDGP